MNTYRCGQLAYTATMALKNAALLAFVGMLLLTVLLAFVFVRDVSGFFRDLIPAVRLLASLIYLLATLGVTVFLFVFYRSQH